MFFMLRRRTSFVSDVVYLKALRKGIVQAAKTFYAAGLFPLPEG